MRYVAHLSPGPAWLPGKPAGEQDRAIMQAHLASMRRRYDDGALLFGGPYRSGFGGMALLEADSAADAAAIMDADPAVMAGVLAYNIADVRPYFDAIAGRAWSPAATA